MSLPSLFDDIPEQSDKIVIVTGGNSGIGKVTCKVLLARGAKVYMGARNKNKAEEAIAEIKKETGKENIHWLPLDLASLASVKDAVEHFKSQERELHILVNNAGLFGLPFELTKDGYEVQWATNVVGHFAFTTGLLPLLEETAARVGPVRVINVSSEAHRIFTVSGGINFKDLTLKDYWFGEWRRYGQSKLGNILITKEIARRYGDKGIISIALHPGEIVTQYFGTQQNWSIKVILKISSYRAISAEEGAYTQIYAATHERIIEENLNGAYLTPMAKVTKPSESAQDKKLAEELWDYLEKDVASKMG